jgi:hypothetical protein
MYVFHAWKSSLELFLPNNLYLFCLVTLKLIRDGLKTYFKYVWPFFIITIVSLFMAYYSVDVYGRVLHNEHWIGHLGQRTAVMVALSVIYIMIQLCYAFCSFLIALSVRPSVDKKNCAYMRRYTKKYFVGYLLLQTVFFMLLAIPFCALTSSVCCILDLDLSTVYTPHYYLFVVFNIFAVLFYLDLNHAFITIPQVIWFAIKLGFYNLPFVLIVTAGASGLLCLISYLPVMRIMHLFIYPLLFCVVTNYYTKKVHDQARLYQG